MKARKILEETRSSFVRLHHLSRSAPLGWVGMVWIYFRLAVSRFIRNNGFTRASALSYSILFAIIPGLAFFSLFMSQGRLNEFFSQQELSVFILKFLPYTTQEINSHILRFVANSLTIGWIGGAVFLFTLLMLVTTLENIFNTTWNVPRDRPVHMQIGMMFIIIVLFFAAFLVSYKLRHLPFLKTHILISIPFAFFAFAFLSGAFSVLYKLIPRVRVRVDAAVIGGILAAGLYEIGRFVFRLYVSVAFTYSRMYGAFSLIAVFIISLYVLSTFIILGAEMSCVEQNYEEFCRQYLMRKGGGRVPLLPDDDEILI
jgi:membrane protein